jgi:hypothetical protein
MPKIILPIRFLKLNDNGSHLLLKAHINGKSARMLVDTGASNTVFDKERLAFFLNGAAYEAEERLSTGLGTNTMESHSAELRKLEFGALKLLNYRVLVLNLSHVNVSYGSMKLKPIDGVLGGDILKKFKATIDYGRKKLVLYDERSKSRSKHRGQ